MTVDGKPLKKERVFLAIGCKECSDDFTFRLKSTKL
jgi:hypothetical protein